MSDVFPTRLFNQSLLSEIYFSLLPLCSPKKTSLNFFKGLPKSLFDMYKRKGKGGIRKKRKKLSNLIFSVTKCYFFITP